MFFLLYQIGIMLDRNPRISMIENQIPKMYVLLQDELWFLMSQFGPAYVIGMENPHLGWLIEEIEQADRLAVDGLIEKELAAVMDEQSIEIDDHLMRMVQHCVQAEHTIILQATIKGEQETQRYLHFAGDMLVEHYQGDDKQHYLASIPDRNALISHWDRYLCQQTNGENPNLVFYLPEDILFKASRFYSNADHQSGFDLLQEHLTDTAILNAFVSTLKDPLANTSIVLVANQNNPETQFVRGFGLLAGPEITWIMRPVEKSGANQVEFKSTNAAIIHNAFTATLP